MERSNIGIQFGLYLVVGGVSTVVDVGGFYVLEQLGLAFLVAAPTSFLAGTATNYLLSRFAFARGRLAGWREGLAFALVVMVGLVLNSAIAWLLVQAGVVAVFAKALAIPFVLGWNFLGRRWLVFRAELPESTFTLVSQVLDQSPDDETEAKSEPGGSPAIRSLRSSSR